MKKNKHFNFYVNVIKNNTSNIFEVSKKDIFFIEEKSLLEMSGMSKKQLDLYIFRHPEIIKIKKGKIRLISINIINHVLKNLKRKK